MFVGLIKLITWVWTKLNKLKPNLKNSSCGLNLSAAQIWLASLIIVINFSRFKPALNWNRFLGDLRRGLISLNSDTVIVISSDPPWKKKNAGITTVHIKALTNQDYELDMHVFSLFIMLFIWGFWKGLAHILLWETLEKYTEIIPFWIKETTFLIRFSFQG